MFDNFPNKVDKLSCRKVFFLFQPKNEKKLMTSVISKPKTIRENLYKKV